MLKKKKAGQAGKAGFIISLGGQGPGEVTGHVRDSQVGR
jgi:hypothetical protein